MKNTVGSEKRNRYLNRSADMICRSAYGLCKRNLISEKEKPPDAKELKEICTAVKEAISIASSLDKNDEAEHGTLQVVMDKALSEIAK